MPHNSSISYCPKCYERYHSGFKEGYQKALELFQKEIAMAKMSRPIVFQIDSAAKLVKDAQTQPTTSAAVN